MTATCTECCQDTTAQNTMGTDGGPLCGTCKRQEQWRRRLSNTLESTRDRHCAEHGCDPYGVERADHGLAQCRTCRDTWAFDDAG